MLEENKDIDIISLVEKRKKKREEKKKTDRRLPWEQRKKNIKEWTTFYRRNWNIYAERRLKIKLYPFQHVMVYLAGISQYWYAICSRGASKSMIAGLLAVIHSCLYPFAEVVITSSTIPQATKLVKKKIEDELCKKLSPVLQYYYEHGDIVFRYNNDCVEVDLSKINGSMITVLPCLDSSRGSRATMVIYEERRLLKKSLIDSVFSKMAHPRQSKFSLLDEYKDSNGKTLSRWVEQCKTISITSARFRSESFWQEFKLVVQQSMIRKDHTYNFFASNIFLAILFNLKTWADYWHDKEFDSDIDFVTEDLNEMYGETEGAFFLLEDFRKNQVIKRAYKPPTPMDIFMSTDLGNRPKGEFEKRLLFIDYAFVNSNTNDNDNSVIGCMSVIMKDGKTRRKVEYIGTHPASDSEGFQQKIREFFWDYQADYIVMDERSGGTLYYTELSKPFEHPSRSNWNPHGFTVCYESALQIVPDAKIQELKGKTVDTEAIPCIIPIVGTSERNSLMWLDLKKALDNEMIEFLVDELTIETELEEDVNYLTMSSEEKVNIKLPYVQTALMMSEAISLTQTWNNGILKLSEPNRNSATKDKIVALSYGNHIATLIGDKYAVDEQRDTNLDELDQLVF